jgi:pyruvate-formate lyase-activating enzyme
MAYRRNCARFLRNRRALSVEQRENRSETKEDAMQGPARRLVRPSPLLAARVIVRHRLTEASNLHYPGQRDESAPLWRGMGRSEHVDVAHALVQNLGAGLDGYALTGGEPTLNRPALLELVHYLASAPVRSFWLETNATLLSGPMLDDLREAGLRQLRVHIPTREPRAYARAMGVSERSAAEHLARVEASVSTAIDLGLHVAIDVPVLRGLNDDPDTLLGFAGWHDRGLPLTLVQLERSSHARDPLELLRSLDARPAASSDGAHEPLYELCHDSRCIGMSAVRRRHCQRSESTLHVSADGRVRSETHDASPESSQAPPSTSLPREELEPAPPTLRVVAPAPPWSPPLAVGSSGAWIGHARVEPSLQRAV